MKTPINKLKHKIRMNRKTYKKMKTRKIPTRVVSLKPNFEEKTLCCAIRFYDNQEDIIEQFKKSKKYIESIQVSNSPNMDIMRGDSNASSYIDKFLNLYPDNRFALYLKSFHFKEIGTTVGFSANDALQLKTWAEKKEIEKKIVLFDWDGTLSAVEGIILPETKFGTDNFKKMGITNEEIALYYAGSKNRFRFLRNLFTYLDKINVEIYILTNNPTAACNWRRFQDKGIGPESRANFYKVVKELIPGLKKNNLLCGYETNGFKPDTFSNNEYLRNIYYRIQHWHFTHDASGKDSV